MNILQRLYASEINFSISVFWDMGYDVKFGDDMNGHREKNCGTYEEVEAWLTEMAINAYPNSDFAKEQAK